MNLITKILRKQKLMVKGWVKSPRLFVRTILFSDEIFLRLAKEVETILKEEGRI